MSRTHSTLKYIALLFVLLAVHAANPLFVTAHQPIERSGLKLPDGVSAVDWQQITQQMQYGIAPLAGSPDTYLTNAGQWQVRFDPSGVTMRDAASGLNWKMSLMPFSQPSPQPSPKGRGSFLANSPLPGGEGLGVRATSLGEGLGVRATSLGEGLGVRATPLGEGLGVRGAVRIEAHDATLTYYHNANLQERYDNSAAGLKQTFILRERGQELGGRRQELGGRRQELGGRRQELGVVYSPTPNSLFPTPNSLLPIPNSSFPIPNSLFPIPNSPLRLALALSGSLTPKLADDQTLLLQDEAGQTLLTYAGLYVYDARGVTMPSHFELAGTTLTIVVEDAQAVYPLTIDPTVQEAYIKASVGSYWFGKSLDVSGDTMVVGSADSHVYVFVRSGSTWSQQAILQGVNTETSDSFGQAVAIDGDTIVVGAYSEASNATGVDGANNNLLPNSGAAYVFTRIVTTWSQQAYLKASNTGQNDEFGRTVAIDGDTIVVGAYGEDGSANTVNGANNDLASSAGAAYVFSRSGSTWSQQAYLKAPNASNSDQFGQTVAIDGDTIVVGADGEDSNATGVNGNQSDNSLSSSGAAYVFTRSGSIWTHQAYLKASNPDSNDQFGRSSLAISGNTIAVGVTSESSSVAGGQSNNSAAAAGAVYVFTGSGSSWSQQAFLKASNAEQLDFFGVSVALDGNTLVVGAMGEDSSSTGVDGVQTNNFVSYSGAAYLFMRIDGTWSQENYLKASNPGVDDYFGGSVAIDESTKIVAVGAIDEDSNATGIGGDQANNLDPTSGAVYAFLLPLPGIDVVQGSNTTTEALGTTSMDVKLLSRPNSNVVLNVISSDTTEGAVSASSLTFTPSNWNITQTLIVTGVDDDVVDGPQAYQVSFTVSTTDTMGYAALTVPTWNLTNNDNDVVGFSVSAMSGNTTEAGGSATFGVRLTSQPTGNVGVNVVSADTAENTVSAGSLTFTTGNWNVTQTVTVNGVDDSMADGDQVTAIQLTINAGLTLDTSGYAGQNPPDVNVTNVDNDLLGFTVSAISGNTTEAGGTASFTVQLGSQPLGNVRIDVSSSNTAEGTVLPTSLTFTGANWNAPQTVTLTGVDEQIDDGNQLYTAVLAINAGGTTDSTGYAAMNPPDVTVTNVDNDTAGYTVSAISGNTTEAGGTTTFNVKLTSQPTGTVVIGVSSSNTAEGTVSPATLTFNSGNWSVNQQVTVTGVDELVDDGDQPYTVVLAIHASNTDAQYAAMNPPDVSATNVDNDTAGFTVGAISGNTTEAGGTAGFTIRLNSQPTSNVVIDVASNDSTEGSVAPAQLTFTAGNWQTNQVVMATGLDDFVDDGNIIYTIGLTVNGASTADTVYKLLNPPDVTATNVDNDAVGVLVSGISAHTTEAGGSATFTVRLNSEPTGNVVIDVASSDTTEGTVSAGSLTFTAGNWNISQTVTVNGVNDAIEDDNVGYTILLNTNTASTLDPLYDPLNPNDVSVINDDDADTAGYLVGAISGNTTEAGSNATFTVTLTSEPTSNVVVNVTSNDTTEGTVSPSSLTFTPANWNSHQTVTVSRVDDFVDDGDIPYTIILALGSTSDSKYSLLNPNDVSVTNIDNDTVGFTVSAISGNTTEAGGTATFSVRLTSQPTNDVVLDVSSTDATEGTVSASSLLFVPGNWNVSQTVTVAGVNDWMVDGPQNYQVILGVNTGSTLDSQYTPLNPPDVNVTNIDNDVVGFTVSTMSGHTTEAGGSATFTVKLTSEPVGGQVVVEVSSDTVAEGTASPMSVVFDDLDWNVPQTVTVTGVDDWVDDGDQNYQLILVNTTTAETSGYVGLDPADVAAVNDDDDTVGFTVSAASGNTTEVGDTATFTMQLNSEPTGNVVINVVSTDTTEGTVSPSSLTFDASNWNAPQTVTLTGVDDFMQDGDINVTAQLTVNGGSTSDTSGYVGLDPNDVTVSNQDDDTAGFVVSLPSAGGVTTEMGGVVTFAVELTSNPMGVVVLDVVSSDTTEGTVSPATLTFDSSDWNTPHEVTVTGVDDDMDDGNQAYTLLLTVNSGSTTDVSGYLALNPPDLPLTNYNDDVKGFSLSTMSGHTNENGGTAFFTLVMKTQPTTTVNIPVTSTNLLEGVVSETLLIFDPSNWNITQTVTVTGVDDTIYDPNAAYTIRLGPLSSSDPNYNGFYLPDISAINDNNDSGDPYAATGVITTTEDLSYTFRISDFPYSDPYKLPLGGIQVVNLPVWGKLWYEGKAVVRYQVYTDPTHLVYQPAANMNGNPATSFFFATVNSLGLASPFANMMVIVTPVDDPPSSRDNQVTLMESQSYTLTAADITVSDPEGNGSNLLQIVTLPITGQVRCGGSSLSVGAECAITQVTYTPPLSRSGSPLSSFQFKVKDTTNLISELAYTMSFNVQPLLNAPLSANSQLTLLEDTLSPFTATVFPFNDPDADNFAGIKITSLPSRGFLRCNNLPVTVGLDCPEVSQLTYQGALNGYGSSYSSFGFKVKDSDGLYSAVSYLMTLNVTNVGDAPTSQPLTLTLAQDSVYAFKVNDFAWQDVDRDTLMGLQVMSATNDLKCGTADMSLTSACVVSQVSFIPPMGVIGSPYLTLLFKVQDSSGQLSEAVYKLTVNLIQTRFFPMGYDNAVTVTEDVSYTFQLSDFPFSHANAAQSLSEVWITAIPAAGELQCQGQLAVTDTRCAPSLLRFMPAPDQFGNPYSQFSYKLLDQSGESSRAAYTMSLTVLPAPDAPTSSDIELTTLEDLPYFFNPAGFTFNDADGDTLAELQIVTLPLSGTLSCTPPSIPPLTQGGAGGGNSLTQGGAGGGNFLSQGATCAPADLTFTPITDTYGSPYSSFNFRVVDSTGLTSTVSYGANIAVTAGGDAPTSGDSSVALNENETYPFDAVDVTFADADGDSFGEIKLLTLPDKGELRCAGQLLSVGMQCNPLSDLTYTPAPNENGLVYSHFTFKVSDSSGQFSQNSYTITLNVMAVDLPPLGGAAVVSLEPGQSHTFSLADFPYQDTDGQNLVALQIVAIPSIGQLTCQGQNVALNATCPVTQLTYALPLTAPKGSYPAFSFKVQDSSLAWSEASYALTVMAGLPGHDPIGGNKTITVTEDVPYIFQAADFIFQDSDGDKLAALQLMSAPMRGSLTCNGVEMTMGSLCFLTQTLQFQAAANANGDNYTQFSFKVQDTSGRYSSEVSWETLSIVSVTDLPDWVAPPPSQAIMGEFYNYTLIGLAPDGGQANIQLEGLPSWLTPIYDSFGNLTLTGVPTDTADLSSNITIIITDGAGNVTTKTLNLTVTPINRPPRFVSTPLSYVLYQQLYRYPIQTTDPDGLDTLRVTALTKPAWATFVDNGLGQAVLSGTALVAGDYPVVLEVTDGVGVTSQQSFTLTILNTSPVAVNDQAVGSKAQESLLIPALANDFDADKNPLTLTAVGFPLHGQATLSGSLIVYQSTLTEGTDIFSYTISDGSASATAMVEVVMQLNDSPIAEPDALEIVAGDKNPILIPPLANDTDPNGHGLILVNITPGPTDIPTPPLNQGGTGGVRGNMARDRYGKKAIYLPPVADMGEATAWHETYYYTVTDEAINPRVVSSTINVTILNPAKFKVDVQLARRTEITQLHAYETEEVVSYLQVVNTSDRPAANVVLTETVSGAKVLNSIGLSNWGYCQINVQKVFVCNIGQLAAGARVFLTTTHTLQTEPGTVIISSTLGSKTNDPDGSNNLATLEFKVKGKRETRQVGQYAITANRFNTLDNGRVRASGVVKIGSYFQLLGADDWVEFNELNITAMQGTLATIQGMLPLYQGSLKADSKGAGQFDPTGQFVLQQVAGFTATNMQLLTLDLLKGMVSGEATLLLSSGGMTLNSDLAFTLGADLSWSGAAKQASTLMYGSAGLKVSDLRFTLLKITKLNYGLQSRGGTVALGAVTLGALSKLTINPDLTFTGEGSHLALSLNNSDSLMFAQAKLTAQGLSSSSTSLSYGGVTANLPQKVTISPSGELSLLNQPFMLNKTVQGINFWLNKLIVMITKVNGQYRLEWQKADLVLVMPQNNRTIPNFKLDGTVNEDLVLKVGSARVKLKAPIVKDNQLRASQVEWQLPFLFGGGRYRYDKVVTLGANDNLLTFMNSLPFPTDLKFGSLLTLSGLKGSITQVGNQFEVGFDGDLSGFDLPGVNTLKIRLSLDAAGRIRGTVPEIAFKFIGFESKAKNMSISATMSQPGIITFEVEEAGMEQKSLGIKAGLYGLRIEKTYFKLPENWKLPSVNVKTPSLPTLPTVDFKLSSFGLKLPDLTLGTLHIDIPALKVKLGQLDLSLNLKLADFNLKIGAIRLGQIPSWDLPALKLKLEGLGLDLTGINLPDLTIGELSLRLKGINLSLADLNLKLGNFDLGSLDINLGSFKIRELGLTLPNLGLSLADIDLDLPNMDLPNMTLGDLHLKLMRLGFSIADLKLKLGSINLDGLTLFGDFTLPQLGLTLADLGLTLPEVNLPDLSVNFPSFDADLELPDFNLPTIPQVDLNSVLPKIFLRGAYVDIPDFKIGGFHIGSFKATLIEKTKDKRDYVLDGVAKLNFSDIPGAGDCQFESQVRIAFDPILGRQVVEVTPLTDKPLDLVITPTNSTEVYTLPTLVTPEQYHQPLYVGQQGRDPRGVQVEKLTISMSGANCSGIHLGYGVYLSKLNGSFTLIDGSSTLKLHLRVEWPSKAMTGLNLLAMEADMDMKIPVQRCTLRDYIQFRNDIILGNPKQVIEDMSESNCKLQETTQSVDQLDPAKAKELPYMLKAVAFVRFKQGVSSSSNAIFIVNSYLKYGAFCEPPYFYKTINSQKYDTFTLAGCQSFYRDATRFAMRSFDQKYLSTPDHVTKDFADWVAQTQFEGGGQYCLNSVFSLYIHCYWGTPYYNLYEPWVDSPVSIISMVRGPAYFYKDTLDWFDNLTPAEVSQVMRDLGVQSIGVKTEHYKEPFLLTMNGTPEVLGSSVGNANITMKADKAKGSFNYKRTFGPINLKMGADFATWWGNGFGFTSKGDMDLRVSLAFIDSSLSDIGMDFHIKYELGKFNKPGGGQTWGIKGAFSFDIDLWLFSISFDVSFYIDINGNVAVGSDVDDYKLVNADAVRRAKQVQETRQRAKTDVGDQVKFLDPDPDLTFLPASDNANERMGEKATDSSSRNLATSQPRQQDVMVNVNVANQQPAMIYLGSQGNGPTLEVIGPDGQVIDPLHLPSGISYTQEIKYISGLGVSAAAGQGLGQLRVVNGAETAGALDVLVNDQLAFSQVPFANTALYRSYPPGSYTVKFVATGTTSPVLAQATVNLAPGVDFTVVASPKATPPDSGGVTGGLVAWPIQDDNNPRGDGNSAYLRFIHAGTGLPKLTLSQVMGHTYFKEIAYQRFGDYYKLFPMEYLFDLSDGQKSLLETAKIPLAPKGIYSMFVFNTKEGARVVIYQDAAETARLQLVNTTGQPLTVNIDQLPYQPLVTSTNLYFAPGDRQVKLGSNSQTVKLTSEQNSSLLAYLKAGQLQTLALYDTPTESMGGANLRLVHVAEGQPNVTVKLESVAGHALSLPSVSFEQTTPFTMVAATGKTPYTLTLLNATNGQPIATQVVRLDEATNYTLYVYRVNGQWAIGLQENIHLTKKVQTFYGIAGDKAGRYQVRLKGDTLNTEYDLQVKGNKPKPVLNEIHVNTSDGAAPQIEWHLDSAHEPKTSVRVYAQNSPIVQTAVVTNNDGTTELITQTVYDGVDISEALTSTASSWVDGSLQSYPFDLTKLVDGTYYLYVEADDGVNQRVRLSAPEPLVVKHEWPATWNANLQLSQAGYREITATWQSFPDPNGKYTHLVWQEVGEVTTQTVRLTRDVLTQTIGGLKVGQTYQVWVEGFDYQNDRISPSEAISITVPGPEFSVTGPTEPLTLKAGESLSMVVKLTTPLNPYPTLARLYAPLQSQFEVSINPEEELVPTQAGSPSKVYVTTYPTVPSGVYTLTLIAASDGVTHALELPIEVQGASFELVGSTDSLTLTEAGQVTMTIAISRSYGHYNPINLMVVDAPPMSSLNGVFDNNRLMLGEEATLTLSDWPTAIGGVYSFTIAATDGNQWAYLTPTLYLEKPDYTVTPPDTMVVAEPGRSQVLTVPVTVTFISGWSSPVQLWIEEEMTPPYSQFGFDLAVPSSERALTLPELQVMTTVYEAGVVTLTLAIAEDTPMGIYLLPFSALSNGRQIDQDILLKVGYSEDKAGKTYLPILMQQTHPNSTSHAIYLPILLKEAVKP